jgi:hypothetical protein
MKLIKIDGYYIVVSNESPAKEYTGYYFMYGKIFHTNKYMLQSGCKNLIASQNPEHNLPIITFSDEVAEKLGIVDVEEKANDATDKKGYGKEEGGEYKDGWEDGYNQCLSNNKDKQFTLEQIRVLTNSVLEFISHHEPEEFDNWFNKKLQRLTKTEWDVELEMEQYTQNFHKDIWYNRPKITNNSIKVIKLCTS